MHRSKGQLRSLLRTAGAFATGYLLGSFSFARLVGHFVAPGDDLEQTEVEMQGGATLDYRGVSATAIAVRGGPAAGIVTGVFDAAKSFVPTIVAKRRWPDEPYYAFIAAGCMTGHNWPLYHGFKGGRGQTPFYGGLAAMDWVSIPITSAAGAFLGIAVFRDMLAAYSLGMWLTIPWAVWRRNPVETGYTIVGNALFSIAMIPEMRSYFALRNSGGLESMGTFKDFIYSYPAMRRPDEAGAGRQARRSSQSTTTSPR
jgi:acyl phosphate:glycerol-3-phosphate acyltransferase